MFFLKTPIKFWVYVKFSRVLKSKFSDVRKKNSFENQVFKLIEHYQVSMKIFQMANMLWDLCLHHFFYV